MSVLRYFSHIFNLLSKRKKVVFVFIIGFFFVFILLKDFQDVLIQSTAISFNQSIYYCNKPHHVSGEENVGHLDGYKLRQIQILIRHGDRAPINLKALPNIAPVLISCMFNKTEEFFIGELNRYRKIIGKSVFILHGNRFDRLLDERFACRGGQLTPYGFLQHLYLGGYLQNSYNEFLNNIDLTKDIWIQSTNVQRTIQSAAALMTGIFYEKLKNLPTSDKLSINIFQDTISDTHFLLDYDFKDLQCQPLMGELKQRRLKKNFLHYKDYNYLSHRFSEVLSVDHGEIPPINRIADILYTKLCHGQGVPYGPHARIPSHLVEETFKNADLYFSEKSAYAPELQTLSILSQIALQWLKHTIDQQKNAAKKFVLYSGHDSMITPFLVLLGVNDGRWPPYASRVVFEFYEKSDTPSDIYFRVLYNGQLMKGLKFCRPIDGEYGLCHIRDLYQYVSKDRFDGDTTNEFHPSVLFEKIRQLCMETV